MLGTAQRLMTSASKLWGSGRVCHLLHPKSFTVPNNLAYLRLAVRLQQAFEGGGDDGYGVQRGRVLVDPLQIGLDVATVFWGCRTLPPEADGIVTSRIQGQHGFEPKVTDPVIDEIVDVSEALPPMSAQRRERHVARISIEAGTARLRTAILLAVDTAVMQMHVAPREDDP